MKSVVVVTPPEDRPLTVQELIEHLRLPDEEDDGELLGLIDAATGHFEDSTNRQLMRATLRLSLDAWPCSREIELHRPPLASVTQVQYMDTNETMQTLASSSYWTDADATPGRVFLKPSASWPSLAKAPGAVRITYLAGWATAEDVPRQIRQAIRLLAGHFYENREATTPAKLENLPSGAEAIARLWHIPEAF